jgi:hypothetical protein
MDHKYIVSENVNWNNLAQGRVQWGDLVSMLMNFRVP